MNNNNFKEISEKIALKITEELIDYNMKSHIKNGGSLQNDFVEMLARESVDVFSKIEKIVNEKFISNENNKQVAQQLEEEYKGRAWNVLR